MGSVSATSWTRFYDAVVVNDAWPRQLWSLAVGDALAQQLAETSPLVTAFRRHTDELLAIEQRGPATYREERRLAELEAQLRTLAEEADSEIRGGSSSASAGARVAASRRSMLAGPRPAFGSSFGVAAVVLVAGGLLGASVVATLYVYDQRLRRQIEVALEPHLTATRDLIAEAEERLDERIAEAGAERATAAAIRRDLEADAASLRKKIADSLNDLREASAGNVTRPLETRADGAEQAMARMKIRGEALGRGLDEVSADLASLETRLPEMRQSVARLGEQVEQGRAGYRTAEQEIEALQALAAGLGAKATDERTAIEAQIEAQRQALDVLDEQIAALKGAVDSSSERIGQLEGGMQEALTAAESRLERLETAAREADGTSAAMTALLERAESVASRLETEMARQLDTILTETTEQADLAMLRSEDVLRRAENQALRQIGAGGEEAAQAVSDARQGQLARLSDEVEATRVEIEQTRAGLIASWQRMDALVAERYDQLLSELDDHAATLDAQIERVDAAGGPEVRRVSDSEQPQ